MASAPPESLRRLLAAPPGSVADEAWTEFVQSHSRLILHVARSLGPDHDAVMDRYAHVLEQLRREDFRRLRTFVADGRSEFTTWLVVVTQRLCLDHRRQRYGRGSRGADAGEHEAEWRARRRLVDLVAADVDLSTLQDGRTPSPEDQLRSSEALRALDGALERLAARDRMLVKLRFEDDLPMPDIARALGYPTRFHAYRRLSQVLVELRHALESAGIRESVP